MLVESERNRERRPAQSRSEQLRVAREREGTGVWTNWENITESLVWLKDARPLIVDVQTTRLSAMAKSSNSLVHGSSI